MDELSAGEARVRVKALEAKLADLQQRAPWIPSTEQLASALESVPFYDHKSPEQVAPDMRAALVTRMQSDAWDTWQVQGGHGWVITSCGNGDIIVSHESHGSASIAPNPTIPRVIPEALLRALSESLLAGERPTLIGVDLAACEEPAPSQAEPLPAYRKYTTQPGEAVAGIALRELKDESRWVEIRDLNAHHFHDMGPHDYYPVGTELTLPGAPAEQELVRLSGEVCGGDAQHNTVNVCLSQPANWSNLKIGTRITLLAHHSGGTGV